MESTLDEQFVVVIVALMEALIGAVTAVNISGVTWMPKGKKLLALLAMMLCQHLKKFTIKSYFGFAGTI